MEKPINKDEVTYAVISYLWLLSFVVFFATLKLPKSEFLHNHIKNGIVIAIITTIFLFLGSAGSIGLPICFLLVLMGVISAANEMSFPINLLPKSFNLDFLKIENIKKIFSKSIDSQEHQTIEKEKLLAAISYLWILWIPISIFYSKDSEFIKGHVTYAKNIFYISLLFFIFTGLSSVLSFLVIIMEAVGFIFAMSGETYPKINIDDMAFKNNQYYIKTKDFINKYLQIIRSKYQQYIPEYRPITDDEYESISLCYLFLAPFYMMRTFNNDSKIVKFHASQSSILILALIFGMLITPNLGLPTMILAVSTMLIGFLKSYKKEEFLLFDR